MSAHTTAIFNNEKRHSQDADTRYNGRAIDLIPDWLVHAGATISNGPWATMSLQFGKKLHFSTGLS